MKYLTIKKFCAESGYTPDAVRSKIKRGDWLENVLYMRAPDDRILINTEGYERWVENQAFAQHLNQV